MKRILSVLLALVMVLGMIPMVASAATESATITFDAAKTQRTSFSTTQQVWAEGNITFTNDKASSSNAIADYSNPVRLYQGSSVTIAVAEGNITEILIVSDGTAKYKTALQNSITGAGATYTNSGNNYTITLDGSSASFTMSMTAQARFKSITVTYATVESGACTHANTEAIEAKDATCVLPGNTAGVKCADCGLLLEGNEVIEALGHTESVTDEKAATCTEDGYTQYTCSVCENVRKDYIDATGHTYVDGVCSSCGLELPTDLAGKYYIAAIRKEGNYQYMTNDLGTADTKRYQIVDSGVTTLPESIEDIVESQLFELIEVEGGYIIKTGEQYLGYNSGNSGALVTEDAAKVVTIEYGTAKGSYNIHFAANETEERYLALNSNADYAYYAWYVGMGNQITDLYLVPVAETAEVCEHANATTEGAVEPGCTTEGATGTTTCPDCGATLQNNEVIPANGHNYVDGVCDVCGEAKPEVPSEATITFDDKTKRTEFSTTIQVWEENGVKVTNNKASSTSNVGDYVKPARFYKGSTVTIEYPGMTKIVFNCNTATYATDLGKSITGATVTVTNKTVTVELTSAADSFTTKGMNAQVRVDSLTVYTTKVCNHVWGEAVLTTAPACAVKGENTYTCTLCGETKTEAVAALGHIAVDGFCSVCGGEFYTLATSLNEGDSVVLFNSENEVAMGVNVNSFGDKMLGVATDDATGLAVTADMAVMQVQYVEGSETDFYLVKDGKYLTTGATGNSLSFADEANDYSKWYLEVPFEGEQVVLITNRNAVFNSNAQSIEYYNGAFTTYSRSTGKNYQMKLYVKAAPVPVEPTIELTHVSLDPAKDALGFKAAISGDLPAGAQVGIKLSVEGGLEKTYLVDIAELKTTGVFTLRLNGIMAANGGEKKITGTPVIMIGEEAITGTPNTTSMKQTIIDVNAAWDTFNDTQQAAVKELYNDYAVIMAAWLGADNKIVPPVAEAPAA